MLNAKNQFLRHDEPRLDKFLKPRKILKTSFRKLGFEEIWVHSELKLIMKIIQGLSDKTVLSSQS